MLVTLDSSNFPSAAQPDGDDIRFTDASGANELSYWIESWDYAGKSAKIWVKVAGVPAGSSSIRMYYGNPSASSSSNGDATFEFFDDFDSFTLDSSKWVTVNGGMSYTISDSIFNPSGTFYGQNPGDGGFVGYQSSKIFGLGYAMRAKIQVDYEYFGEVPCSNGAEIGFGKRTYPVSTSSFVSLDYTSACYWSYPLSGYMTVSDGSTDNAIGWGYSSDYNIWDLIRMPNQNHRAIIGSLFDETFLTSTPSVPLPITLGAAMWHPGNLDQYNYFVDFVSVRKYASPEPTVSIGANTPANLALSINAPASMDHGNMMTYTLYYTNLGAAVASNVVLEGTLPSNLEFSAASDGGIYDINTRKIKWDIGSVSESPSGRGSRSLIVRIPSDVPYDTIINSVFTISTITAESRYDDNIASASTKVDASNLPPDVSVSPTNGNTGGMPSVTWNTPITFSFYSPCASSVEIGIIDENGIEIRHQSMSETPSGSGTWTYATTFTQKGQIEATYTVFPSGCNPSSVIFNVYVDPAGYIYDMTTGERIEGASVWLQRPDGSGGWENIPTGQSPAVMQPDENPLITGADGQYQWDVLEGSYRVHVEAPGYYQADSIMVSVPPPVTDLHVGLTPLSNPRVTNLTNVSYAQNYIKWTWTDPSYSNFSKVMVYLDGKWKANVTKGTQYYNATGLLANTSHTIATRTVNTKGNISRIWVNNTARTAPDLIPPSGVTNLTNASYAPNYIKWTWTDPKNPDFSKVMVFLDGKFKANVTKGKQYYNATGLLANSRHTISTHTVDINGNINQTWVNNTAWTAPDFIPPASITSLANASYARNYIKWTWIDPKDTDFSKVMVYLDGKFKKNVTRGTQNYNATGLLAGTRHNISTHTVDINGNINQTWVNNTAWTSP